ncbi:hypothetical protein DFAR_950038 [Desulfarculales bacterium]
MSSKVEWLKLAPGVRVRQHPTRKHGVKADRYFVLRYVVHGRRRQEALGWASDRWTLTKVQAELVRLKEAIRTEQGPSSLAEKRQQAEIQDKTELATLKS